MASDSTNECLFTEEMIQDMQRRLLKIPIDPAYDWLDGCLYDGWDQATLMQMIVRSDYEWLKEVGRLPEGYVRPGRKENP